MPRYIDADMLEEAVKKPSIFDINKDDVLSLIAEIPTADVVEVVRCKDCAHRVALPKQYDYNGHFAMVCLMRSKSVKHNGYCDEGIRKAKKGGG